MIRFKTDFTYRILMFDYLGIPFDVDSLDVLLWFCPASWMDMLNLNLRFYSL